MPSFTKRLLLIIILFFTLKSQAGTIKGHVYDESTKEQLVGAIVSIKSLLKGTATELDGSFIIRDLSMGRYTVNISYLGFETVDTTVSIDQESQTIKLEINLLPSLKQLKQVVVKSSGYGGSDEFAHRAEQRSISQVNIVSANAIQISPDITVANVMQRVSGVTMDRGNSGEAQYAIIRGMDKRYNTTLVNGIKIPSPNDKDRYVPLDIFPAELLERLEVIKTLLPSMEGDATGGIVNLVMKSAPYKFVAEGNFGIGYSNIFQHQDFFKFDAKGAPLKSPAENNPGVNSSPSDFSSSIFNTTKISTPLNSTASLTLGNRFMNNKLGIILSGSFQNTNRGTDSKILQEVATVKPSNGKDDPLLQPYSDILIRQYSTRTNRLGVESKVEYNINDNNSLSLLLMYLQLDEYRVRFTGDSLLGGYSYRNGYQGIFAYGHDLQIRQNLQNIYNATLQGKHKILPRLSADWSLVASEAAKQQPNISNFAINQSVHYDNVADRISLGPEEVGHQTRQWLRNTDKDLSGYLNLHYTPTFIPGLTNVDAGGMYRHKDRKNYANEYKMLPQTDSTNTQYFTSYQKAQYYFLTNTEQGDGYESPGSYTFTENIFACYLQLHENIGSKIKLDGGFRYESTIDTYYSSLPASQYGKTANIVYSEFLPSIMSKYELNKTSAIRASYYRSINRPAFSDFIPYLDNTTNENYSFKGNPDIQHAVVNNYDLRYELFPKGLDQLLAGVFYKQLNNAIEHSLSTNGFNKDVVLTPTNIANSTNYGLELVYRKFFGNFGVSFNYTYTHSIVSSLKKLYFYDSATHKTINDSAYEKRPLQGQAPHIGNFSLLYKDKKLKLDAQLALVYTGERLFAVSAYYGLDNYEKARLTLDLSLQKEFKKHFIVYFKATNLLNSPAELIVKQDNKAAYSGSNKLPFQESNKYSVVQKDIYYSTFLIGLRFKF